MIFNPEFFYLLLVDRQMAGSDAQGVVIHLAVWCLCSHSTKHLIGVFLLLD
jgi:hypothetical protein